MNLFTTSALAASAPASAEEGYRTDAQTAADQVALAEGSSAEFVTREAANSADMMAFYPAGNPTRLISCIEGDREEFAAGKLNPSVQAVALDGGAVPTLLRA